MSPPGQSPSPDFEPESESVVRRAPFSDNPPVGARGQRTQQRILDAALQVFGEEGYQNCSIDRITKRAGCSRVSFYQYFSSKEDVFRQLAGQVARQLTASTDALDPLTPDLEGWSALRAWVARHAEIYERYQPVFHAFQAASERDEVVAIGSARWGERIRTRIRSSLDDHAAGPPGRAGHRAAPELHHPHPRHPAILDSAVPGPSRASASRTPSPM